MIARACYPRVFFPSFLPPPLSLSFSLLPLCRSPSPFALATHFHPGQFRRLHLTSLSCDRRTFHRAHACSRVCVRVHAHGRETASYAIHFFFYFIRVFLPGPHTSYHAPLTTAMSIIPGVPPQTSRSPAASAAALS